MTKALLFELEKAFIEATDAELQQDAQDAKLSLSLEAYRLRRMLVSKEEENLHSCGDNHLLDLPLVEDEDNCQRERSQ